MAEFKCDKCGYEGEPRRHGTKCPHCNLANLRAGRERALAEELGKPGLAPDPIPAPPTTSMTDAFLPPPVDHAVQDPTEDDAEDLDEYEEVLVEEAGQWAVKRVPRAEAARIESLEEPQDRFGYDPTDIGPEYYEGGRAKLSYRWTDRKLLAKEYRKCGFLPVREALNGQARISDGAEGKMVSMPSDPNTVLVAAPLARVEAYRNRLLEDTLEGRQAADEEFRKVAARQGTGMFSEGLQEDTEYRRAHGGGEGGTPGAPILHAADRTRLQAESIEKALWQRQREATGRSVHAVPELPYKKNR